MSKVLFVGVGLTHYYNKVLDKIGSDVRIDLYNAASANSAGHVGAGVYQEETAKNFKIIKFEEKKLKNHHYFKGLTNFILKNRIDTIVVTDEYLFSLFFNPVIFILKITGKLRIFLKSIPFRMKTYEEIQREGSLRSLVKSIFRKVIYNYLDGHLNYIDDGKRIYGSFGVDINKIYITGNSPDTELLEEIRSKLLTKGIHKNTNQFIHVGRLVEWKRVDMLIKAFNTLLNDFPDSKLVIVGDGPELNNLKQLAHALNLDQKVEFKGAIHSYETLGEILLHSSCYVLAGMGGLSINDAMAFGLPVIVSVCDGTEKQLVEHGYNGYFFQDGSEQDLYLKMKDIASNPENVSRFGANSLKIIREKVNIGTVVNKYKEALI